jgi:putative transcriptional regulator
MANGEQLMAVKPRKPIFERLKTGLEEAIAHAKGELSLRTIDVPEAPPEIDATTLVALREAAQMSQVVFAKVLHVSAKTVQSWEQGMRVPSKAARRLIQVFAEQPAAVCKVVGLPAVDLHGFKIRSARIGKRRIASESPRESKQS